MKKRMLSVLLALVMLFGVAVWAPLSTGVAALQPVVYAPADAGGTDGVEISPQSDAIVLKGGETIETGGSYVLDDAATGVITIDAEAEVIISGSGVTWDDGYNMTCTTYKNVKFDCAEGTKLTLKDMFIEDRDDTSPLINFTGLHNYLKIEGTVVLDKYGSGQGTYANIHVAKGSALTIGGNGTLYLYKTSGGAGIGGNAREMNGDMTFGDANSLKFKMFAKGTKQGALIGAGTGASSSTDAPGAVRFVSGEYNLISNSRGAVIGGSAGSTGGSTGTTVYVEKNANININVDFSGAAVGGGGYATGNDASGGTLYVNGGSLRSYIDKNAAGNTTGWNGQGFTEGINDAAITAQRLDGSGEKVYWLIFDTNDLMLAADSFNVSVDGKEFYSGGLHRYGFVQEGLDKGEQLSITSTVSNWYENDETRLFFYVTGENHVLTVNGEEFDCIWDSETETFTVESRTEKFDVTFKVTPEDADITVSSGIGYTYVENTFRGDYSEEEKTTVFSLEPGNYTATITKEGYYASAFSFKVDANGTVYPISEQSMVKNYLAGNTFTITLNEFAKSANSGAWDGTTLDVSWYDENETELIISDANQLAGLAAIVNGIYNAEITAIIDDADGDGVTETYTPREYAALENRKIRTAISSGDMSGGQGLNQVTSDDYWFGVQSDGETPSDFNGKTIYITADIDMGGYKSGDGWTGARYMPIGGQYQMHYIDSKAWASDGLSHLGASFNGRLDGQGHFIKNVYCDRYAASNYGDSQSVGLVGRLGNHDSDPASLGAVDPAVRNLALSGYIYGRRSVGGFVGKIGQTSASRQGDGSTGGIIENCINFATVKNTDAKGCGGIAGAGWNKGVIRSCANFGNVSSTYSCPTGGISGSNEVPLENCYNVGTISAGRDSYAMAIGTNNGGAGRVTDCFWLTGCAPGGGYYSGKGDTEITDNYNGSGLSAAEYMKSEAFLAQLNGTTRSWVIPSEGDEVYRMMEENNVAGNPVPRVFINDDATLLKVEKRAEPEKLTYVEGQVFDTAGLELWAVYSDSTEELLTSYDIEPSGALTKDIKTVKVTALGYEFTFNITVEPVTVDRIDIASAPANLIYAADEKFSIDGIAVNAYYTDAPASAVPLTLEEYTWEISDNGELIISYVFEGKSVTDSCQVYFLNTNAPAANDSGAYELKCENDVVWFANQVNALERTDIDAVLTASVGIKSELFNGIGASGTAYGGTFDGQGNTLTVELSGTGAVGAFAYAKDAVIKNLTVDGTVVSTGQYYGAAGFIAQASGTIVIENCVNKANITAPGYTGGIVGKAQSCNSLTIRNSKNTGAVTVNRTGSGQSSGYGGGIVAQGAGVNIIENCVNIGTVTSSGVNTGGIAGYIKLYAAAEGATEITGCKNEGRVISESSAAGGIVGYISSYSAEKYVSVKDSCNTAEVSGTYSAGGIVGTAENKNDIVAGCYNSGNISVSQYASSNNKGIGGIIGTSRAKLTDVYNAGSIDGSKLENAAMGVGGIIGVSQDYDASVTNAYNAGNVTGNASVSGGAIAGSAYRDIKLINCMWLDGTAASAVASGTASVTGEPAVMSAPELKSAAEALGGSFKKNPSSEHNGGFPALSWEEIEATAIKGDANGDGRLNSLDAMLILQLSSSGAEIPAGADLDMNDDGRVNSIDAMLILQFAAAQ